MFKFIKWLCDTGISSQKTWICHPLVKDSCGSVKKKSVISLESQQRSFFSYFLSLSKDRTISADKMMNKAKGPVWHKKQKDLGIIPKGLRGVDKKATWCKSKADGWVYGHGSFSLTTHKQPVLGCFLWMRNAANEAKRMWLETYHLKGKVDYVAMDSKADDADLFREFKRQRRMNMITYCRPNMDKTPTRRKMIKFMEKPKHKKIYRERSFRVEPMQGLVKEIFELDRCWMRGDENNRWIFATAMGLTVQMHQL